MASGLWGRGRRRRFPAGRRSIAPRAKENHFRRGIVLLVALAVGWGLMGELGSNALSPALVQEAARNFAYDASNAAIQEALAQETGDFFVRELGPDGRVLAIQTDAAALARLRSRIYEGLGRSTSGKAKAKVSLGSLSGLALLNGRGPKVPLKLDLTTSANVSFVTDFRSAGLNQSCWRLSAVVSMRVHCPSRRFETDLETETSVVLGETVVIGEIPSLAALGADG